MANGLLDWLSTPAGQGLLAAGLGAAASAGRRGSGPLNALGTGGLMGISAYTGAQDRQAELAQAAKRNEVYDMQVQAYKADVAQKNAEMEAERRRREVLPSLFRGPGMTGGEASPQSIGGIPMFSQPMGVTPMKATPGGFDAMAALQAGYSPAEIEALANVPNVGKPKATRQMEVDDGRGGKRIALVDDYGREVAGFAGYTAPVQVNQGDRVSFVKPAPGVQLPMNMSPDARASNAVAWANHGLSKQRLALEQGNMVAEAGGPTQAALVKQLGKPPTGYRWKADGSGMEAIPGGPADIKAGELGAKAKARQESGIAQADSVLKEVRDAKGMVGWNTAGLGGALSVIPATEARDLAGKLQTIKANLGFDRLQQMRDQSPTGGALGQVAVQELASLQATVASLDQLQSPRQVGQALDKIEKHYAKWRDVMEQSQSQQGGASGEWGIQKVK
jgi:hypothetical protein